MALTGDHIRKFSGKTEGHNFVWSGTAHPVYCYSTSICIPACSSTCNWYDVRMNTRPIAFCFQNVAICCTNRMRCMHHHHSANMNRAVCICTYTYTFRPYTSWPSCSSRLLIVYNVHLHSWRLTETTQWATFLGAEVVCWTVCIPQNTYKNTCI